MVVLIKFKLLSAIIFPELLESIIISGASALMCPTFTNLLIVLDPKNTTSLLPVTSKLLIVEVPIEHPC